MKQPILILLIFIISLVFSCPNGFSQTNNNSSTESRYTGPIIDMHLHAYKEGDPMLGLTHPPTLRGQTFKGSKSAKELQTEILNRFEKYNIKKAILTNADFWYTDVPETIINAKTNNLDTIRFLHSQGKLGAIAEMAPYYAGILADDPSQEPYFELAEELQIPVGFHILPGGPNNGIHLMPEMLGGMRVNNASPTQLEPVLAKFPKLKLYIMHGGWPYVEDVKALLYAHANVYVDIAVINWILPKEELYSYIKSLITAGFGDRIMFGTDQMVWPDTIDVAIETVNSAEFLTQKQKADIFYNNAARFLGLGN